MVKRKGSNNGNVVSQSKKVKKVAEAAINTEDNEKIDFTSPATVLYSLTACGTKEGFFKKFWEKEPLLVQRGKPEFYGNIFTLDCMKQLLDKEELNFETDVNVCRFVDGKKDYLNEDGQITKKDFETLMDEKHTTFQFHQPQRFSDGLWKIMEKLETLFGCLVGCNIYITPASSQGLAPHCDDVEIFVLQLEGTKTWKLYKPMVELSRDYTQDLNEDDIGEPIIEHTLQPGDMLYLPRGYIHQAKTTDNGHSVHASISTYQLNTWGDFMNHAVTQAIENAIEDDVKVRTGLPINYLSFLGTGKNFGKYVEEESAKTESRSNEKDPRVVDFKEKIKNHLAKLIDHIDVNTAADAMCADFMASRLPPYKHVVAEDDIDENKAPKLEDKIKIRHPEHMRIVFSAEEEEEDEDISQCEDDEDSEMEDDAAEDEKPAKEKEQKKDNGEKKQSKKTPTKRKSVKSDTENDEDDDDDDVEATPDDEDPCIKIIHSLNNAREAHMIGDIFTAPGVLKLPVHFGNAAISLLESKDFVCIKDIALEDDDDKLTLATNLYADDLIEIQSA